MSVQRSAPIGGKVSAEDLYVIVLLYQDLYSSFN